MSQTAKRFFTIKAASAELDVPESTLRYWESVFQELRPKRTPTGHRRYSEADIAIAGRIKELLHGRGMTIEGARTAMTEERKAPPCLRVTCGDREAAQSLLSEALESCPDERVEAVLEWLRGL